MRAPLTIVLSLFLLACNGKSTTNAFYNSGDGVAFELDNNHPYPDYASDNYGDLNKWLCHPEKDSRNVCHNKLDARVVQADGSAVIRPFVRNDDAPIDCLYFLPTTSLDATPNANFFPDAQEKETAESQFAAYAEVCRPFAPIYRQVTLTTLAANVAIGFVLPLSIGGNAGDIAYADVLDAYRHYMAHDNNGRGYILVGHSQGSGHLKRLIAEEIEPVDYLHQRMISAHLLGTSVAVPHDAPVGGSFLRTPTCEQADQYNCVISYASFRQGDPQLADPRFAMTGDESTRAACTNPAALSGGEAELDAYFPYSLPPAYALLTSLYNRGSGGPYANRLQNLADSATTPYFKVPGQIHGECVYDQNTGAHYLEIRIESDPDDPRADDYPAEFVGGIGWGMHIADVNLALGDLLRLSQSQAAAWLASTATQQSGNT